MERVYSYNPRPRTGIRNFYHCAIGAVMRILLPRETVDKFLRSFLMGGMSCHKPFDFNANPDHIPDLGFFLNRIFATVG